MFHSINLSLQCRLNLSFHMTFSSHMSVLELKEFLFSSHLLHQASQSSSCSKPIGLTSKDGNLLINFMLASQESTLIEVFTAYKYISQKERLSLDYIKQHEFIKAATLEKQESMPLMILYEDQPSRELIKEREIACYIQDDFGAICQKPTSSPKLSTSDACFGFTEIIQQTYVGSPLIVKKKVSKSQLATFEQVQRILLLKKRLIEQTQNHHNIYGDFKEILEQQSSILFCFTYVPTVSFSDILHLQLTYNTVEHLIYKIWAFLTYLKHNRYEAYICRLHRQRNLKELLDKLHLTLDNRIVISDLNVLLEEGGQQRFQQGEYENLVEDVKIYVKLHKSHLLKFDDCQQAQQEKSINLISSFTFSKVFLTKTYRLHTRPQDHYSPKTDIFSWKREVLNPETKEKNINEATTAKKPRSNMRLSIEKPKKKGERSPNCSLVHCSVNRTKWKRHK